MSKLFDAVIIGGVNCDIAGKSFESIVSATSNPGTVKITSGGVSGNIAQNLTQLGIKTAILSSIGKDGFGELLIKDLNDKGIDTSHIAISKKYSTGIYLAILSNDGELVLGLSGMEVIRDVNIDYLKEKCNILTNTKYIVCDTNIEKEALLFLIKLARQNCIPICVEPVSVSKSKKLLGLLDGIDIITPNKDELFSLSGLDPDNNDIKSASSILLDEGVKNIILTLGSEGLCLINAQGTKKFPAFKTEIKNVTGAGDALTAGLLFGLLRHESIETACNYGLAAAALTLSSENTVNNFLSRETLLELVAKSAI
ncbi:MAG: ribokinase [Clostridiales bacterium]|nr:ribokinase [Clostridiales bacterium]